MNTNLQVWWSPHSTADSQRFIKINSRDQELTVYDVLDSVCSGRKRRLGRHTDALKSDDDFRFKEYAKYSKIPYMRVSLPLDVGTWALRIEAVFRLVTS
jgi:hypothetical protein